MIRNCQCGHRNHRSGVGTDLPIGCRVPGCGCSEPTPVACILTGWTQRWECDWCGRRLPAGARRWCDAACELAWQVQHVWSLARPAALERDHHACVVCGASAESSGHALEVNHIEPRRGGGYLAGCHHHGSNLETCCHTCHVLVTNAQRSGLSGSAVELLAGIGVIAP